MTNKFDDETKQDCLKLIELALTEDIGSSDIDVGRDCTTDAIVPKQASASAKFVSRESGVVCGVEIARLVVENFSPRLKVEEVLNDGDQVEPQQTIAMLVGPAHDILTVERTCLNFMCRLSGISSLSRKFVDEVAGTKAKVLDTRKTTPGWRRLEKYAVGCGGGANHRMGLYDAIMIKDNHLAFYRSLVSDTEDTIPDALKGARKWIDDHKSSLPNGAATILQLEVDTLEQFEIALQCKPDIVLLDNMSTDQLSEAIKRRDEVASEILLEASGGVNLKTIKKIAQTGIDRISVGALTHSARNFDIGLDWSIG
jgi:nicotinate-nucleotide pyrophosphorylase (carboxylating)